MSSNNNNNNLTTSIPVFMGSEFQVWEQKMGDYLKSQCLWCFVKGSTFICPVEAIAEQPTAAELQAQMDWDESDLQVQGIFGSWISQILHPHLGTNATGTWTNLRTWFRTPGISKIAANMYAAYSMKLSTFHNPHPEIERMNMLFKCLNANSMTFSDAQQGLILLNMILKEWSMVAQIYSQANWTLATTTFIGVWDAMAEFECSTHPSTIAAHCISAVKCKGKSPTYTEQTSSKSTPPKAFDDVPSGTP